MLIHASKVQKDKGTAVLLIRVLLVFVNPHVEQYLCKNLQFMLFHAHLVSPSACISLKSDNYGLADHYMDTCPNKNKTEPWSNFMKHSGYEKLLQNKKASKGWEYLLYVYI